MSKKHQGQQISNGKISNTKEKKKFLDLLIPPKDYWKSKYSFDFGEPDNVSTNQNQTVPINIEQPVGLPTDFNQ